MDWDNVRVFPAVPRGAQFVAAAKRLRLDHATVSRRIYPTDPAHPGTAFLWARENCLAERFVRW
jgi:hypothetical protein